MVVGVPYFINRACAVLKIFTPARLCSAARAGCALNAAVEMSAAATAARMMIIRRIP
jgi:hypothetical protein